MGLNFHWGWQRWLAAYPKDAKQLSIVCQIAHHLLEARPRDRDCDIPFSEMIFKKIGRGHECENERDEILQIV
jgi:hypothetical protein